jgi:hypothetical protein
LSAVAEGIINVDIPGIHSMLCIYIQNTSDFSDKVPFPIERLDGSVEELLEDFPRPRCVLFLMMVRINMTAIPIMMKKKKMMTMAMTMGNA